MQAIKNKNIPVSLQLIKTDLTYEDSATVSFIIYNSDGETIEVSETSTSWNENLNSYISTIVPSVSWVNQETGTYLLVWNISNTEYFASTMIDELVITEDNNTRMNTIDANLERILGLVHQNMVIDETIFDREGNLYSARVRIFRDSLKTDLITTYRISAVTTGPGKFSSWEQVEE